MGIKIYNSYCIFLTVVFSFVVVSCHYSSGVEEKQYSNKTKNAIIKKPGSSFNDTIVVNESSAIFYKPDTFQLDKIKAVNTKPVFEMLEHDCYYQMRNARMVLEEHWPRVKIVEALKVRYVLFVKKNKSIRCIDLNDKNDICGIFLFDGKKDPVLIDMPNVDTELGFYFGNTRKEAQGKN